MQKLYATLIALGLYFLCVAAAAAGPFPAWDNQINSPGRFKVLDEFDGRAVFDKETGLVWQRSPSKSAFDWFEAHALCNNAVVIGNRLGWRLPTIQELASVVDPTEVGPSLPPGHPFLNVQSPDPQAPSVYWSATTNAADPGLAWGVFFHFGGLTRTPKAGEHFVWCVRGGQGVDAQ